MKYKLIFILYFINTSVFANDNFARKICNVYKSEHDKNNCFNELREVVPQKKVKAPLNQVLVYGGSACKNLDSWKKVVNLLLANKPEKIGRLLDRECSWLKEKSLINGPFKEAVYKESKFVLVKHNLLNKVWIEPSNFESKKITYKKVAKTKRLSRDITLGNKRRVRATDYSNNWPFPLDSGGTLYCKKIDSRRMAVWLNGTYATYALNGQAITWMEKNNFIGVGGKPTKKGRDNSENFKGLINIIDDGLSLCN